MNRELAKRVAAELAGKEVAGWRIGEYLGFGNSAVVLKAEQGDTVAALKLFDREVVALNEGGEALHLEHLNRQFALQNHDHPSLVRVLGAGKCPVTGYTYVLMELLQCESIETALQEIPRDRIRVVISQIAAAAMYLHNLGIVHRDIKPSNIAISGDYTKATLLDLGVIRPVLGESTTDHGTDRPFFGTLRYAPPEFYRRQERHDSDGWRAVTYYQLGGVLHDLIMRKPLFSEFRRDDGSLQHAIENEIPRITADDVAPDLVALARDCLIKNPSLRLEFVTWERFMGVESPLEEPSRERLMSRLSQRRFAPATQPGITLSADERTSRAAATILMQVDELIRDICVGTGDLPPVDIVTNKISPSEALVSIYLCYRFHTNDRVWLRVVFGLSVADPSTLACRIQVSCEVSNSRPAAEIAPQNASLLFAGTFDRALLEKPIEHALFALVDSALQVAEERLSAGQIATWDEWVSQSSSTRTR